MKMMTNYEAHKKRKRNPKIYGFHTFSDPGCPIFLSGPFRGNIRSFLRECADIEEFNITGMPTWSTLLANETNGAIVPLYTIEEETKHSKTPFCDHCRCVGWSHHFVSKRRYHFIIPNDEEWSGNKPLGVRVFDDHTHLLHGLVHCNGYGHLLCINGLEGGSKFLTGREIMDLWDRLCTALGARKMTVEDTSRKRSMDVRLLYGAVYGNSWFGRWGFKFCNGSFGVSLKNYEAAISVLSSANLDDVVKDFAEVRNSGRQVRRIVQVYRQLSDTQLMTLRDLFRFMFELKAKSPLQMKTIAAAVVPVPKQQAKEIKAKKCKNVGKEEVNKYKKFSRFAEMECRWPARRLEFAAEVIVDALKEADGGLSRQEVRDAARLHIGDTGLLDYVIKSINNCTVRNYVVRRAMNPSTKVLQFTVEEIDDDTVLGEDKDEEEAALDVVPNPVSGSLGMDVHRDIEILYNHVLENYPVSGLLELATQVVLDSKHFVKEWPIDDEGDSLLRFVCQILPKTEEIETSFTRPLTDGELVVLPLFATIGDLKGAAEDAFRDTYCILERFVARELEGVDYLDDDEVVFGAVESGAHVWVRGSGIDLENKLKYEGGAESWIVDCSCGAKDDDGERMVSCDMCEVWQHTRCIGIEDTQTVPPLFLCSGCSSSLMGPLTDYSTDMVYA